MKRWSSLIMSIAVALAMVGCDGSIDTTTPTAPDAVASTEAITTAPSSAQEDAAMLAVREELIKQSEIEDFGELTAMELYENGVRVAHSDYVQVRDNKKIYHSGDMKRVVNYPDGFRMDMPASWEPDFSMSSAISRYSDDDVTLIASDETDSMKLYMYARESDDATPTAIGEEYVRQMFQYITADSYLEKNDVTLLSEETSDFGENQKLYVLKMHVGGLEADVPSYYTYAVIYSELRMIHLMFRCVDDRDFSSVYLSVRTFGKKGSAIDTVTYPHRDNPSWNSETKALYEYIMGFEKTQWGIFTNNLTGSGIHSTKFRLAEKLLDHKFEFVSTYTDDMNEPFPTSGVKAADADGRIVQYTFHMDAGWGNTMGGYAPTLDVYRGKYDERFRKLAHEVIECGVPILMRVNNEMNSDWTTWSAVNTMLDPDIFTATWRRLYDIFEEEGANAYCIWVWNPQSANSFPNTNWNDIRTYMPGVDYVDMIGLTSYNFGSEERWDTFEQLYQWLEDYFGVHFSDWGWIISEFGCCDTVEDDSDRRAQWVTDMFACLETGMFPNIKVAVWFNTNDFNPDGTILRELTLTDDKKTREAFKNGINGVT